MTPEQIRDAQARYDVLNKLLASTDHKATKYAEGWYSEADYVPIKAQRQAWRDEINAILKQLRLNNR